MPEIPYQDDQVTEVLIEGAPDWLAIKRGSMRVIEVGFNRAGDDGQPPYTRFGFTAIDKIDGAEVFFYVERLIAVKYTFEEAPTEGRLLP